MRKLMLLAALVVAAATVVAVTGTGRVAVAKADNGAVVINDIGCVMLDGDGGFVVADSSHAVVTSNGNGVFICKASDVANSTGKAVNFDNASTGILCATPAGITDDWNETVSQSGQATLRCHVNGS